MTIKNVFVLKAPKRLSIRALNDPNTNSYYIICSSDFLHIHKHP